MSDCVVVQPIDLAGIELLRHAGLDVYEAASPEIDDLLPHLRDARAVITRDRGFPARAIAAAPCLEVIASHGTGTDRIDKDAASARGIRVINTPGTNAPSVAEHALGLMLACARQIPQADRALRAGDWAFREHAHPRELGGRSLGLVGFGRVARQLAQLAQGLGMKVLAYSTHAGDADLVAAGVLPLPDLDSLLAASDVVSLHGLPTTEPLIDAVRLARLRPDAILINTARGALIDEAALAQALCDGRLAAAALDVFSVEPLPSDSPLFDCPNLILTPHIGGTAHEALERTAIAVARKVIEALNLRLPEA